MFSVFDTDVVDLYKPEDLTVDVRKQVQGVSYPGTATASNVACHFEKKREGSTPGTIGRVNADILDTTDRLHLPTSVTIGDGWAVHLKTPGHPDYGTWFMVQGESQALFWKAKRQTVLLKPSLKPAGV